ncbi:hypothetical protein EJ04DRAFT_197273 [Polyplosphaeria fusca]|uniref:Uncharacterized protein n=1 Tax=Polyplosphaeria fusca TaxID=682080 RepID=A0A9P4V590_9PLEO|nr:hypothetical protein EJ04DRAFT_197273 [Polyplosphaeria fusca]
MHPRRHHGSLSSPNRSIHLSRSLCLLQPAHGLIRVRVRPLSMPTVPRGAQCVRSRARIASLRHRSESHPQPRGGALLPQHERRSVAASALPSSRPGRIASCSKHPLLHLQRPATSANLHPVLGDTRTPWTCAHSDQSFVPIVCLDRSVAG